MESTVAPEDDRRDDEEIDANQGYSDQPSDSIQAEGEDEGEGEEPLVRGREDSNKWDTASSMPRPDYYMYDEYEKLLENKDFFRKVEFAPVARNVVEAIYKIFLERDLRSYLYTNYEPEVNHFDDRQTDLACLTRRPPCYIIFGKPGIGRTTAAMRLAKKLNTVYISATSVIEFYLSRDAQFGMDIKEILESGDTIDDNMLMKLFDRRIKEMDVLHRGYIIDDFPLLSSEQIPISEQMEMLQNFVLTPDFAIVLYMQDLDLYRRRVGQMMDSDTNELYVQAHYEKRISLEILRQSTPEVELISPGGSSSAESKSQSRRNTSHKYGEDFPLYEPEVLDGSTDFPPITEQVYERLVSRPEDNSILVNDEFGKYREAAGYIQEFVDGLDKRKTLEVNAYWSPTVVFKNICDYLEIYGIAPVVVPSQILRPLKHHLDDYKIDYDYYGDVECEPDESTLEINWETAYKSISVRGTIDPRFRWRISEWKNLCPVALKLGKSIAGRPEFGVSFLNKAYFLSSQEAVEQFVNNPRPFLLPPMPTSPIKFFVIGHPLSGKTLISHQIASLCQAEIIDMKKEHEKRYDQVKFDYLMRHRIQITFDAIRVVEKENKAFWKRGERKRRIEMHEWIDKYLRGVVQNEIAFELEEDREKHWLESRKWLEESFLHKLQDPVYMGSGTCQEDHRFRKGFSWEAFIEEIRVGKNKWTHQQRLEIAWDLFRQGKLYYKSTKKRRRRRKGEDGEEEEEEDSDGNLEESPSVESFIEEFFGDEEEESSNDESDEDEKKSEKEPTDDGFLTIVAPNERRKLKCATIKKKKVIVIDESALEELTPNLSSVLDADDELEESIMLRFPTIPFELVESVPKPDSINEKHPLVEDIIKRRMKSLEENSNESEIYTEILRRAILEAESRYRKKQPQGPLTGGWVVDNLIPEIETWRLILRTHDVSPDQVIVLIDYSPNYANILTRLKNIYRKLHPKLTMTGFTREGDAGEGAGLTGEIPGEFIVGSVHNESSRSSYPSYISEIYDDDDNDDEEDTGGSRLGEDANDSASDMLQIARDANRQVSIAGSHPTSTELFVSDQSQMSTAANEAEESKSITEEEEAEDSEKSARDSCSSKARSAKSAGKKSKQINFEMISYAIEASNAQCEEVSSAESKPEEMEVIPEDAFADLNSQRARLSKVAAEDARFKEIAGEDINDLDKTPSGLLSLVDMTAVCPEGAMPEDPCHLLAPPGDQMPQMSGKRKFMLEIRNFELFWNMVIPVLHEQEIRYWEMGIVDENTVVEKVSIVLDELQGRFCEHARNATKVELGEDEVDARESMKRWGETVKLLKQFKREAMSDEEEDSDSESEVKNQGLIMEDEDDLASLEYKPDLYRAAVENAESLRYFGDFKDFCPVTFVEKGLLRKGYPTIAAKYKDRLYYFATEEYKLKFIEFPLEYMESLNRGAAVPRICITGVPGCSQAEIGLEMAKEYNVCYVNFRQRLHELMKARFGFDIGPEVTGIIVPPSETEAALAKVRSSDDIFYEYNPLEGYKYAVGEDYGESDWPQNAMDKYRPGGVHDVTSKTLGLSLNTNVATIPISSIQRTEILTSRKWKQLSKTEAHVKAFIENGTQLPEFVLDEFIAPLWTEKPFTSVGFILVGFPNTKADGDYLVKRDFIPEHVFVMESNPLAIRNRLLIDSVDRWHQENNPSGKRKVTVITERRPRPAKKKQVTTDSRPPSSTKPERPTFEYQTEGREEIKELVDETWTYNDKISKQITSALRHYHNIYSKDITDLKKSFNQGKIEWTTFQTDLSLIASLAELKEKLNSLLKYRSSILESTLRLNFNAANTLIDGGYFELSQFKRWCPVEISKGNKGLNSWNIPAVNKIPILHRRYIYFIAGEKNAKLFQQNVLEIIKQEAPIPAFPILVAIIGTPKSGKTTLARKISENLGLVYVSGFNLINNILKHTTLKNNYATNEQKKGDEPFNAAQNMVLAEEILCYLERGMSVPQFLLYRTLDYALMEPKAQHHGVVFDDYPLDADNLQDLIERGSIPVVVAKCKLHTEDVYQRNIKDAGPTHDYVSVTAESRIFIQESVKRYKEKLNPVYRWFSKEIQVLIDIDMAKSPNDVFTQLRDHCIDIASKIRHYTHSIQRGKPCTIEATSPITSDIPQKLSPDFGKFCPVSLNDRNELVIVQDLTDLTKIVEYDSEYFALSTNEFVQKFIDNPLRYLPPNCARLPPTDMPNKCSFTVEEFEKLQPNWGFMDFDSVMYTLAGSHPKALQRGNPHFGVEYLQKYYIMKSEANREHFMRQPARFANILLPSKLPRKLEAVDLGKITPYCYIATTGLLPELRNVIHLLGCKRPRVPFMSSERCCALYMAYYFKTLNMNAPFTTRQKYREAMFRMMSHKMTTRDVLQELQSHYGTRFKKLPEKLRANLEEFLELALKKDEEKVLIPTIPDLKFNYDSIGPMDDEELRSLVEELLAAARKGADIERSEAFRKFCTKRKKELDEAGQKYYY